MIMSNVHQKNMISYLNVYDQNNYKRISVYKIVTILRMICVKFDTIDLHMQALFMMCKSNFGYMKDKTICECSFDCWFHVCTLKPSRFISHVMWLHRKRCFSSSMNSFVDLWTCSKIFNLYAFIYSCILLYVVCSCIIFWAFIFIVCLQCVLDGFWIWVKRERWVSREV